MRAKFVERRVFPLSKSRNNDDRLKLPISRFLLVNLFLLNAMQFVSSMLKRREDDIERINAFTVPYKKNHGYAPVKSLPCIIKFTILQSFP